MKKRNLIKMIIIALILISILGAVMWYSKSINKLLLIENIKQAINEENNITTIDVTGIELGKETEHEHIYKTVYDEEKHWEECTACGEKNNISNHEYIDQGWIMGNSCDESNMHKFNCECGYNYKISEGRKTHNMIISNNFTSYAKEESCTNCTLHKKIHQCIKSDGTEINCMNLGTCAICGYTYSTSRAYHVLVISRDSNDIEEKEMFCSKCKINMGTLKYMRMIKESNTNYKFQVEIVVPDGAKYIQNPNFSTIGGNVSYNLVPNINGNVWSTELTININEYREFGGNIRVNLEGIYGGIQICWSFIDEITKLDTVPPVVSNIEIGGTSLTEWSKIKQIIVSGTEDYCNTVKIRILNDKENVVFSGETTVNNGNYSISCIPELEAVIEGRTFKVIVTDSCGNSTEQEFSISKIDAIPPEATSNAEVGGEWSKEKSFTAVASDYGIGNVQIAFNDVSDYQLATANGTEYSREYKLVGDVYSPTKARVFYKDELNNISSQEIMIDKLDNTAPTITGSSFNNNKLIIEANDIKEGLGEGSGVIKYRFMTSESKLENPEITKENCTEVSSNEDMIIPDTVTAKYVYVVAEDLVRKYK